MKQTVFFFLLLFFASQLSFAQQVNKDGKYSMQKRQEKLALSSPGDISPKSYSNLKNLSSTGKIPSGKQEYTKTKPGYRTGKKSRKAIQF